MELKDLKRVVLRAFNDAKINGLDFLGQINAGVKAVQLVRPSIKKSEAIIIVNTMLGDLA